MNFVESLPNARADALAPPVAMAPPVLRPRGSNHVGMRQFNERVVLQAVRLNGSLPKADLARLTGLTLELSDTLSGLVRRSRRRRTRPGSRRPIATCRRTPAAPR